MDCGYKQLKNDWRWSDRFLPEIRRIVGPYLLEASPLAVDRHEATDMVVLRAKNLTIACRVRRPTYGKDYSNQFTLRSRRGSGAKVEFEKICEGWGDLYFYGFSALDEKTFSSWSLIDLSAFRNALIRLPKDIHFGEKFNLDGTGFRWYDLTSFPKEPPILIASSAMTMPKVA